MKWTVSLTSTIITQLTARPYFENLRNMELSAEHQMQKAAGQGNRIRDDNSMVLDLARIVSQLPRKTDSEVPGRSVITIAHPEHKLRWAKSFSFSLSVNLQSICTFWSFGIISYNSVNTTQSRCHGDAASFSTVNDTAVFSILWRFLLSGYHITKTNNCRSKAFEENLMKIMFWFVLCFMLIQTICIGHQRFYKMCHQRVSIEGRKFKFRVIRATVKKDWEKTRFPW